MKFLILLSAIESVSVATNINNIQELRRSRANATKFILFFYDGYVGYTKECLSCGDNICDNFGKLIN